MCQHCLPVLWGGPFSPAGLWVGSFPRMGILGGPLRAGWLQISTVGSGAARGEEDGDAVQCDP